MPDVPPFLWADAGTFTAPHVYTVPGAGEVQPYTSTATYVNASGQAIRPALRIKSSSGNLLALVFPSDTIADGTSAEVSFVPPFGSAASSPAPPPSGGFTNDMCVANDSVRSNIPADSASHGLPYDQLQTSDASIFALGGGGVQILQTGVYRADAWLRLQTVAANIPAATLATLVMNVFAGGTVSSLADVELVYGANNQIAGIPSGTDAFWNLFLSSWFDVSAAPTVASFSAICGTVAGKQFFNDFSLVSFERLRETAGLNFGSFT